MARPRRPVRNIATRSWCADVRRFLRLINTDEVFGTHNGLHLPLNRQSAAYARKGIDLDAAKLADWIGATAATLMPLIEAIRAHVFAVERIHANDTTVPVLAKGKTRTGRLWTY